MTEDRVAVGKIESWIEAISKVTELRVQFIEDPDCAESFLVAGNSQWRAGQYSKFSKLF